MKSLALTSARDPGSPSSRIDHIVVGFPRRLILIAVMCAVLAVPIVGAVALRLHDATASIAAITRERAGLRCGLMVSGLLEKIESARLELDPDLSASHARLVARGALDAAVERLAASDCAGLIAGPRIPAARLRERLRTAFAAPTAVGVASATIPLANDVLALFLDIGDASGLTYDPTVEAVNLDDALVARIPGLTEFLDQSAETLELDGSDGIARAEIVAVEQRSGQARATNAMANDDFDGAASALPSIGAALQAERAAADRTGMALAREIDRDAVAVRLDRQTGRRLRPLRQASIVAGQQLMRASEHVLEASFDTRVSALRQTISSTTEAGALALVAGALVIAFLWRGLRNRDRLELERARERELSLELQLAHHDAKRALALTKQYFRTVFDGSNVGIAIIDDAGGRLDANAALEAMFDHDLRPLLGKATEMLHDIVAANDDARRTEHCFITPLGARLWVDLSLSIIHAGGREAGSAIVLVHDITEHKTLNSRLDHETLHDALTGLPNRVHFIRRLSAALHDHGRHVAVLFIDLDRFKLVNDTLGHHIGDEVLRLAAQRLRGAVRPADVVARLHGDEFAVLLSDDLAHEDVAEIDGVVDRLRAALDLSVATSTDPIEVSASIGLIRDGAVYEHAEDLLAAADAAMYRSKHGRRGGSNSLR